MGIDLRLLPFDCDQGALVYSHTILDLGRNCELQREIRKLPALPVPDNFRSFVGREPEYNGICYGVTNKTPYGDPLQFVLAGNLCAVDLPKEAGHIEQAIWAYLKCLPHQTKVALYWN